MTTPGDPALTALRAELEAERSARLAPEAEVAALAERNRRLDHLVQELRQAACGKRSEKLTADERQLSFEDLETAVAEVESAPVGPKPVRAATPAAVSRGRGPDAPLRLAHCWSHGRRKLREVFDSDASPIAEEGLRRIAELYAIEAGVRGQGADARLAAGHERSAPLVAAFRVWLDDARARVSAKSVRRESRSLDAFPILLTGEKLGCFARHWDGLVLFLADGRIELDANPVENAIRPLTLNRTNALFAGHDEGGRAWARIASLIETCKLNGVDPLAWLAATLEAIAAGHRCGASSEQDRRLDAVELPRADRVPLSGVADAGPRSRRRVELVSRPGPQGG